jgi:hypothetical protein
MKIHPADQNPEIAPNRTAGRKPQTAAGPSFEEVLKNKVQPQPAAVSNGPSPQQIQRPRIDFNRSQTDLETSAAQLETSLDALEAYRGALADPHVNLREVAPLVASLEAIAEALAKDLADLPAHHPLKELGDQTRAAIHLEQIRFRSGTYN